jgi:iron(III) transport system permease protein
MKNRVSSIKVRSPSAVGPYVGLAVLLVVLGGLMVYPLVEEVRRAFVDRGRPSLVWVAGALGNDVFRRQLLTSLALAGVVTVLCNLIAFPLSLIGRAYQFRGKAVLAGLVLVPMVLPPFVGAIGMRQLLGRFGSLTVLLQNLGLVDRRVGIDWLHGGGGGGAGGFWALAALIALGLYPIAYLNLQASLANIDPAMLEAAQNLGGRRWRNFWKITLPLAMPGVFAGSTLVFIWAFTELGAPLLLNYRDVVSRSIWDDLAATAGGNSPMGFAKVVIVLAISVAVYLVGKTTLGRSGHAMVSKAAVAATARPLGRGRGLLAALPFVLVTAVAMLPHVGVVLYSVTAIASEAAGGWGPPDRFGWYRTVIPDRYTLAGYRAVFGTPEIYTAIVNSIKYAGVATLLDVVLGVSIAWVVVRTTVKGRGVLDAVAMLPLAVPGLVMAFGFIALLLQLGLGGMLRDGPFWVLVVAYAVRRLPYLVRSAAGGLQQTSVTLEEAAANLGAPPWRVLWKVTLPLILPNLIAGSLLTFSFAMLEVSDSMILAQLQKYYPITTTIYGLGTDASGPANVRNACALGVVAMGLMTATIVAASLLLGKRLGAVFRA